MKGKKDGLGPGFQHCLASDVGFLEGASKRVLMAFTIVRGNAEKRAEHVQAEHEHTEHAGDRTGQRT